MSADEARQPETDDAPEEDAAYRDYVREKVRQGLADAEAGRVLTHEEMLKRLARWRDA